MMITVYSRVGESPGNRSVLVITKGEWVLIRNKYDYLKYALMILLIILAMLGLFGILSQSGCCLWMKVGRFMSLFRLRLVARARRVFLLKRMYNFEANVFSQNCGYKSIAY